ncbi:MAG: guanylate kinase [Proteobacteria bacterium]|nr:guanylate kinase [Pseudomonadota bacterium]MBU1388112.1 guanylate kinase [Pseudomonadota bacterium]MBU1542176.1 guanylate kinase [Pseudomonadota bacterium]MBU2481668.1 guanylate kinase [Pseudomonadota bacterium]
MNHPGKLFIISAPSGAGKSTLIRQVLKRFDTLSYSISHTTRSPRKNEVNGQDYFFITAQEFEEKIDQGDWLEWAKVHDHYYGTSKAFVNESLEKGQNLILDIDVQGAKQILDAGIKAVTIFIMAPSFDILAQRLKDRGTDTRAVIEKRLENARREIEQKELYQYCVVNDDLDEAIASMCRIFENEILNKESQ